MLTLLARCAWLWPALLWFAGFILPYTFCYFSFLTNKTNWITFAWERNVSILFFPVKHFHFSYRMAWSGRTNCKLFCLIMMPWGQLCCCCCACSQWLLSVSHWTIANTIIRLISYRYQTCLCVCVCVFVLLFIKKRLACATEGKQIKILSCPNRVRSNGPFIIISGLMILFWFRFCKTFGDYQPNDFIIVLIPHSYQQLIDGRLPRSAGFIVSFTSFILPPL